MNHIKYLILIVFISISFEVISQDTLDMKEVYIDNDLVYKMDGQRFTGLAQQKRKNGKLNYEEQYKDGVILWSNLYFNTKEKKVSDKTIYNRYKLWIIEKEIRLRLSQDTLHIKTYDENGKKILLEQFENNKVTYSCEYNGKKRHGQEMCYDDDGNKLIFQYVNGKKVKEKKRK
jgi:antitoxin component YwqK of YwqJK toxin-antitoxin module